MPVKLTSGGKVILKQGKVSCTCCAPPAPCCMYPAQALADGLFSWHDCPDNINAIGSYFLNGNLVFATLVGTKSVDRYLFDAPPSGVVIGYPTKLDIGYCGYLENPGYRWFLTRTALPVDYCLGDSCLIGTQIGFSIEDQFADSYTITGPPGGSVTVTRQSLCDWQGTDQCGNPVYLNYVVDDDFIVWSISWTNYFENPNDCIELDSSTGIKEQLSSPVGNYYENEILIGSVS